MHRTFVGDFQKPLAILSTEIAFERDDALDAVKHAVFGFAFAAISRVDAAVAEPHSGSLERKLFAVGVEPHRHRGAGAEGRQEKIVRARP